MACSATKQGNSYVAKMTRKIEATNKGDPLILQIVLILAQKITTFTGCCQSNFKDAVEVDLFFPLSTDLFSKESKKFCVPLQYIHFIHI